MRLVRSAPGSDELCGGGWVRLGGAILSALPMHPAGLASAGQVDSSSEETSSSSSETDVEVISPHPQELPLHTLNSPSQEPDFTDKWDQISSASVSG